MTHEESGPLFAKVLVANRGEIAVRVLETCADLGISTVAVYSEADRGAKHVRVADEAVLIGGTPASESYLNIEAVIRAALQTGAEAVHPGYGFLAENAPFAQAVADAGLTFIGPPAAAIEMMGEKVAAREFARAAGVPQVPGSAGAVTDAAEVLAFGGEHGYPVAIKAAYGGGGRGMRLAQSAADAVEAFEAARREALSAFGNADVYLERYLTNSRHVEVQVFADTLGNTVWLGDRDCSIQRRHQKVIEESPAPGLTDQMRSDMGQASASLASAVGYVGAGTVEFLVDDDKFYFLEMNTRIQVEHPVTEEVLGVDLIVEQLRVAAGLPLSFQESGPTVRGHAIEVRLNAEDVSEGMFLPAPGSLRTLDIATPAGVRFDSGYDAGDEVLPYYDSLIGKIISWAPTRQHAIDRLLRALAASTVVGVPTTIPAAALILDHPDFRAAKINTRWLEAHVADGLLDSLAPTADGGSVAPVEQAATVWVGEREYAIPFFSPGSSMSGTPTATISPRSGAGAGAPRSRAASEGSGTVTSPMQGTVAQVLVTLGDEVTKGDRLFVLEAMKMENPVRAGVSGILTELLVAQGDVVAAGARLALIVAPADASV